MPPLVDVLVLVVVSPVTDDSDSAVDVDVDTTFSVLEDTSFDSLLVDVLVDVISSDELDELVDSSSHNAHS